jgi:PST family polysaccharide transporter
MDGTELTGTRPASERSSSESADVARGRRAGALRAAALSGSLWSAMYRWSARLVSFVTFAVLSRLLDPEQFGVVAMAGAVAGFLGLLVDFGLPRFVVYVEAVDEVLRSTVLWSSLGLGLVIAGGQLVAAPLVADWLHEPGVLPVLQVMAIGYPLSALYGVMSAFQKRELKFRLLAVRGTVAVVVSAVVAVALALLGLGVWSLVAQVLCYSAVSVVVLWLADPWVPRLLWSPSVFRRAFRYGRTALGAAALDAVTSYADGLVVGRRLGVDQLGFYSVSFRLVQVVLDLLVSVVHAVAFPVLAQAKDDVRLLAAGYRRAVTQGVLLSAPAIAVLAALMPQLVHVVFGPRWAPVAGVGAVLAVSRAIVVPCWFDSALLYAVGRVRTELWMALLGAASLVLAVVVGAFWGLVGVALAMVFRSVVLWPVRLVVSCRVTGQSPLLLAWTTVRIWLAAGVAGLAALEVAGLVPSTVGGLVAGSAAGAAAFLAVGALLTRREMGYALVLLRSLSHRAR